MWEQLSVSLNAQYGLSLNQKMLSIVEYPVEYCFTLGQRVVKKGIKLSLNMAPEAKIAARRLGLRLFLHKITALNAFWDTYEVSKRGSVDS